MTPGLETAPSLSRMTEPNDLTSPTAVLFPSGEKRRSTKLLDALGQRRAFFGAPSLGIMAKVTLRILAGMDGYTP